jgi:hypothetical protein
MRRKSWRNFQCWVQKRAHGLHSSRATVGAGKILKVAVQLSDAIALRVDTHFAVIVTRGSASMASGTKGGQKDAIYGWKNYLYSYRSKSTSCSDNVRVVRFGLCPLRPWPPR